MKEREREKRERRKRRVIKWGGKRGLRVERGGKREGFKERERERERVRRAF